MSNIQYQKFVPTSWVDVNYKDIKKGDLYRNIKEPFRIKYVIDVMCNTDTDEHSLWSYELIDLDSLYKFLRHASEDGTICIMTYDDLLKLE